MLLLLRSHCCIDGRPGTWIVHLFNIIPSEDSVGSQIYVQDNPRFTIEHLLYIGLHNYPSDIFCDAKDLQSLSAHQ